MRAYLNEGVVEGVGDTTSKTQGGNGGGSSELEFSGDEVDTRDAMGMSACTSVSIVSYNEKHKSSHVRDLTGTIIAKDFDSNDLGGLRNTAIECTRTRKY